MEGSTAPGGNRYLIIIVAVCATVAVVAIVVAVVAVSRSSTTPNITIQGDQTTIGGSTFGQGSSAGSSVWSSASSSSGGRIFTIATGHDVGIYEYLDTSGYLAGFHFDLIDAVCTEAGMDCRTVWDKYNNCWDSTPGQPSHGGQGLMGRWYDACTGWYRTIDRIQVFSFTSTFTKPPFSYLYVRTGNAASFPSRNLANKKVGLGDGWASDERCLARWTDVKGQDNMTIIHVQNPGDIVTKLKSGEIDVAFASALDMSGYTSRTNPEIEIVPGGGFSCVLAGTGMMARKDNDFIAKWNAGFSKLVTSGKFKKLCDAAAVEHGSRGYLDCVES